MEGGNSLAGAAPSGGIAHVLVGLESGRASSNQIDAVLNRLQAAGAVISSLDPEMPWAAYPIDLSTQDAAGGEALKGLLELLLVCIAGLSGVGAIVALKEDAAPLPGPDEDAPSTLLRLAPVFVGGQVRLEPALCVYLSADCCRLAPLPGIQGMRWMPLEQSPRWEWLEDAIGCPLRVLILGTRPPVLPRSLELTAECVRVRRGAGNPLTDHTGSAIDANRGASASAEVLAHRAASTGTPLYFGDQLRLELRLPPQCHLACLYVHEEGLEQLAPMSPEAGRAQGSVRFERVLDDPADRHGPTAPVRQECGVLVLSDTALEPLVPLLSRSSLSLRPQLSEGLNSSPGLHSFVSSSLDLEPLQRAEATMIELAYALAGAYPGASIALLMAQSFTHAPGRPWLSPAAVEVDALLKRGKAQEAMIAAQQALQVPRPEHHLSEYHLSEYHLSEYHLSEYHLSEYHLSEYSRLQLELLLGTALRRLAKYTEALEVLQATEQDARDLGHIAAGCARELGRMFTDLNRFVEAEEWLEKALQGHRAACDRVEEARDLQNFGWLRELQHRFADAFTLFGQLIQPASQALEHSLVQAGLHGKGLSAHNLGHLEEALRFHIAALRLAQRLENLLREASSWHELGMLAMDMDRPDRRFLPAAQRWLERSIGQLQERGETFNVGLVSVSLARLHRLKAGKTNNPEDRRRARQALKCTLESVGDERPAVGALARVSMAELYLEEGKPEKAVRWLEHRDRLLAADNPELAWKFHLASGRALEGLSHPAAEGEYFQGIKALEQARGFLPAGLRGAFLETSTPLREGWIGCLHRRGADERVLIDAIERSRSRSFLEALVARHHEDARQAMAESPEAITFAQGRLRSIDEIQPLLPDGVTCLEAFVLPDALLWCLVRRDHLEVRSFPLKRTELAALCKRLTDALHQLPVPTGLPAALQALSDALLPGLLPWLEPLVAGSVLSLLPHGPLHALPLHLLPLPEGHVRAGQPLLTTADVVYAPSLQAIAEWMSRPVVTSRGAVVIADPFHDLRFARVEATSVASRLRAIRIGTELFLGHEATADALRSAGDARHLHVAVHGSAARRRTRAALKLARASTASQVRMELRTEVRTEGTKTAVMHRSVPDAEPFEVEAITALRLTARLVVLSACEAGAGRLSSAGEAPDLLSWAFLASGARAVIAPSRWVEDSVTASFMEHFYARLIEGETAAAALAGAQRTLLEDGPDAWPHGRPDAPSAAIASWGVFTLMGDWRDCGLSSD